MKQNFNFINNRHKVLYNLILVNNQLNNQYGQFLKPFEISSQKYMLLRLLRHFYPGVVSMRTLRESMLDNNSDVTRLVEKLEKRGFVQRTVNKLDKRVVEVIMTHEGLDFMKQIDDVFPSDFYLGRLTEDQATQLNNLLDIILVHEIKEE